MQVFASHAQFKDWFSNPLTGMVEGQEAVNKVFFPIVQGVSVLALAALAEDPLELSFPTVQAIHTIQEATGAMGGFELYMHSACADSGCLPGAGGEAAQRAEALSAEAAEEGRGEAAAREARAHHQVPPVKAPAHALRRLHGGLRRPQHAQLRQLPGHHQCADAAAQGVCGGLRLEGACPISVASACAQSLYTTREKANPTASVPRILVLCLRPWHDHQRDG